VSRQLSRPPDELFAGYRSSAAVFAPTCAALAVLLLAGCSPMEVACTEIGAPPGEA
jgi:hypothetical protein